MDINVLALNIHCLSVYSVQSCAGGFSVLWRGPTQVYHVLTVENCNNLSGLTECFMSCFTSSPPPPPLLFIMAHYRASLCRSIVGRVNNSQYYSDTDTSCNFVDIYISSCYFVKAILLELATLSCI